MATTTSGWPYVVPTDHPLEYPTVSQALADKLDASDKWQTWAPVMAGGTIKTVQTANYRRTSGGMIIFHLHVDIQTITTGIVTFTLPVTPTHLGNFEAELGDAGNTYFIGHSRLAGSVVQVYAIGTGGAVALITPTVPFTWAPGDTIIVNGTYRCAP